MKTGFSPERLNDPRLGEANAILRACVHCGFCSSACPTYAVTGDERDSPRGRIWLIRDLLENENGAEAEAVFHLDRCLECQACMPVCPSGVDYAHLITTAREVIKERGVRGAVDRLRRAALARLLTDARRARNLFALARGVRFLAPLLPPGLARALRLAARAAPLDDIGPVPGVHPARGERKGRVGVLAGCVQAAVAPGINAALIRLLTRAGIEVVVLDGAACCGALDKHLGAVDAARAKARAVIAAMEAESAGAGLDAVVQTASGCGTMMKDYGHLFAADPVWADRGRAAAARVRDGAEYLAGVELAFHTGGRGLRVAWQAPCSLANGQRVVAAPVTLLEAAGFRVSEPRDGGRCCGSAGVYNVLETAMADELGRRKAEALGALAQEIVVSANIGCMTQLAGHMEQPVVHLVELLDWATGGPLPVALRARSFGL